MRHIKRGFTLLELLIVIMIVALLFSLLIPMYTSYQSRLAVQNSAQLIAMDLTQMRQRAISLERVTGIIIYSSDSYSTFIYENNNLVPLKTVYLKELFQTAVRFNQAVDWVVYFSPHSTDQAGSYWSIVTPATGTTTSATRWNTPENPLMTITSGNYTYSIRLSTEGIPSVATPAPTP